MPANIPIRGDDVEWKRKVDELLAKQQDQINNLLTQINYLNGRSK